MSDVRRRKRKKILTVRMSFLTIEIDIGEAEWIGLFNIPFAYDLERTVIPV